MWKVRLSHPKHLQLSTFHLQYSPTRFSDTHTPGTAIFALRAELERS